MELDAEALELLLLMPGSRLLFCFLQPRRFAAEGEAMSKTYSVKGKVSYEVAQAIGEEFASQLPETQIVGSLRRVCPVVGDVDLLTTSMVAMEIFARLVDEVFVR